MSAANSDQFDDFEVIEGAQVGELDSPLRCISSSDVLQKMLSTLQYRYPSSDRCVIPAMNCLSSRDPNN